MLIRITVEKFYCLYHRLLGKINKNESRNESRGKNGKINLHGEWFYFFPRCYCVSAFCGYSYTRQCQAYLRYENEEYTRVSLKECKYAIE